MLKKQLVVTAYDKSHDGFCVIEGSISKAMFEDIRRNHADAEFTFDNTRSLVAKWSKCKHVSHSYAGYMLYLEDQSYGFLHKVKGVRYATPINGKGK